MTENHHTYARFWKCALQVNPHNYSNNYRGESHGLNAVKYAQELLKICRSEKVNIVGLANHGSVDDTEIIRKKLNEGGIVVFPGFEIATTEKVHWVSLFPEDTSVQQLEHYLGKLGIDKTEDRIRPSKLSGHDLLEVVERIGGFCYAAHVTSNSGLLKKGFNNLWTNPLLRVAQIPGRVNDLPPEYKNIVLNNNNEYQRKNEITLINAKDIVRPNDLQEPGASTLIKMTQPCFSSFLMAFKDPESRIRLGEGDEQKFYSQIHSISIEGGYFNGLSAELSGHLNTVIGGRGTGKSTLLECIRYALDYNHKGTEAHKQGEQIVRENLGKFGGRVKLRLRSSSNNMKQYTVIRRYGEPPRVIDEHNNESHLHPRRDLLPGLEVYGQNEIYEVVKDKDALARVLDRFLPKNAEVEMLLDETYRRLKENGFQLAKARDKKDDLEQKMNNLPNLEEQVQQIQDLGLEEKLNVVPLLEKERQLVPRIKEEVVRTRSGMKEMEDSLPDLVFLNDKILNSLPHTDLLQKGRQILETLEEALQQGVGEINKVINKAELKLKPVINELESSMVEAENMLDREFVRIPSISGKSGSEVGHKYKQLLRKIEQIKPLKIQLNNCDTLVKELEQIRRNLLGEISNIRSNRTLAKQKKAKELNQILNGKLKITVVPNGLRQPLRDFLKSLPNVGEKSTEWVENVKDLTIPGLKDAIIKGQEALLGKNWGMTTGFADKLTRISPEQLNQLETIDLQDQIKLELNVSHPGQQYKYRPLTQLSTGQQCTAILHLLLLDNKDPLIMDQPEDNLDNQFVATRIVQELRSAKTERQFLFATHNANIPVFGDAEWIGVCTASDELAEMPIEKQGSIDIDTIRDQVTGILEGGKEAFIQRKEKYGFD